MGLADFTRRVTFKIDGFRFTFKRPSEAARTKANLDLALAVAPDDAPNEAKAQAVQEQLEVMTRFLRDHFVETTLSVGGEEGEAAKFTAEDLGLLSIEDLKRIAAAFSDSVLPSRDEIPKSEPTAE